MYKINNYYVIKVFLKILTVIEGVLRFEDNPITSGVTVILRQNKVEKIILLILK